MGNDGALGSGVELGDELGLETASLLGVQVADLLGDVDKGGDLLIVALFLALFGDTSGAANLDGEFLAAGVSDELARLLLDVAGSAARFVDSLANIFALAVAVFDEGTVALLHGLLGSLLLEGDLTSFLEVLLADFFLSGDELRDVGVVALFDVLVGALEDGILPEGLDDFRVLDTAKASLGIVLAVGEVDTGALDAVVLAAAAGVLVGERVEQVGVGRSDEEGRDGKVGLK